MLECCRVSYHNKENPIVCPSIGGLGGLQQVLHVRPTTKSGFAVQTVRLGGLSHDWMLYLLVHESVFTYVHKCVHTCVLQTIALHSSQKGLAERGCGCWWLPVVVLLLCVSLRSWSQGCGVK